MSKIGNGFVDQILCRRRTNDAADFDLTYAAANAGYAIGFFQLGKRVLARKFFGAAPVETAQNSDEERGK